MLLFINNVYFLYILVSILVPIENPAANPTVLPTPIPIPDPIINPTDPQTDANIEPIIYLYYLEFKILAYLICVPAIYESRNY